MTRLVLIVGALLLAVVARAQPGVDWSTAEPVSIVGHAGIQVARKAVPQLSETIHVAAVADGDWWFWWSWDNPIAPTSDVDAAAFKIAYVLTPQAHE